MGHKELSIEIFFHHKKLENKGSESMLQLNDRHSNYAYVSESLTRTSGAQVWLGAQYLNKDHTTHFLKYPTVFVWPEVEVDF